MSVRFCQLGDNRSLYLKIKKILSSLDSQLPSYFFIQIIVLFNIFTTFHTDLTIGKLQLDIYGKM